MRLRDSRFKDLHEIATPLRLIVFFDAATFPTVSDFARDAVLNLNLPETQCLNLLKALWGQQSQMSISNSSLNANEPNIAFRRQFWEEMDRQIDMSKMAAFIVFTKPRKMHFFCTKPITVRYGRRERYFFHALIQFIVSVRFVSLLLYSQ